MFHLRPFPTLAFALGVFTSLFSVINPTSAAVIFSGLTAGWDRAKVRQTAFRASLTATCVMVGFALLGKVVFGVFGFTALAMRFVGGILVMYSAMGMLYGEDPHLKDATHEKPKSSDIAVIPLGIPMLAGPGTISTVMGFIAGLSISEALVLLAAILVNGWLIHLFLLQARWITDRLGSTGTKIVTKLMGLILAAVAMQFLINGVKEVAAEIRNPGVAAEP
ncbi:MarC family protein [Geothrix sp. 21YS21S-2]|uniref:MarC family protein n=1 Tax=Geothrix sp. 21YS21S-2 TaxID=3068893 RepID=UPI0027B9C1E3|nr:MarC family protein [Geothrix sp. 21YS21S-2]